MGRLLFLLPELILYPESHIALPTGSNALALLQVRQPLLIRRHREVYSAPEGAIVLGTELICENRGIEAAAVRTLGFRPSGSTAAPLPELVLGLESDPAARRILETLPAVNLEQIESFVIRLLHPKQASRPSPRHKPNGNMMARLEVVNNYIHRHCHQPLTLRMLAELVPCNPVYFSNTYSKVFQISPMQYVRNVRLNKACELLTQTSASVCEIAEQLGFVTASQFCASFRKRYMLSPQAYRIRCRLQQSLEK